MPMYNLLEYSDNYSLASGRFWNYYGDKENNDANLVVANCCLSNNKTTRRKSFDHRTKITERGAANNERLNTKLVVSLKYFNNCYRSLDLPLIICKIVLDLSWSKDCILPEILNITEVPANTDADPLIPQLPEGSTTEAAF